MPHTHMVTRWCSPSPPPPPPPRGLSRTSSLGPPASAPPVLRPRLRPPRTISYPPPPSSSSVAAGVRDPARASPRLPPPSRPSPRMPFLWIALRVGQRDRPRMASPASRRRSRGARGAAGPYTCLRLPTHRLLAPFAGSAQEGVPKAPHRALGPARISAAVSPRAANSPTERATPRQGRNGRRQGREAGPPASTDDWRIFINE